MKTIEGDIHIDAPVNETFAWLTDPRHSPLWMTGLSDVRNVQGRGAGRTYDWTYRMLGFPLDGTAEVLESEAPRRHVVHTTGGADSTWTYQFAPEGDGTRLSIALQYEIPVPLVGKLAESLVHGQNQREFRLNLSNIKAHVEHHRRT